MRISIDADGTIWEDEYPNIGKLLPNAKKIINKLYSEGHDIIINTCRAGKYEKDCFLELELQDIKYHCINKNLPRDIKYYHMDCRKISADIYIDDKNLLGIPKNWDEIYNIIQQHPLYKKINN